MRGLFRSIKVLWVIAFVLGVTSVVFWLLDAQDTHTVFQSSELGVSLEYDDRLRKTALSSQDKEDNIAFRLQQPRDEPELLVTVRHEDGLREISSLSEQDLRDVLVSNINKAYPQRFPEYNQVSSRNFELRGRRASEIVFTYKSPDGDIIKQRFVLIVVSDDRAVYVSAQTKESDYEQQNNKYFEHIFDTLEVY